MEALEIKPSFVFETGSLSVDQVGRELQDSVLSHQLPSRKDLTGCDDWWPGSSCLCSYNPGPSLLQELSGVFSNLLTSCPKSGVLQDRHPRA